MRQYLDLLKHVLENGVDRSDRTGTGTRCVFGYQMRFDLAKGFPVTTTKKLHLKSIIHELLWFLTGETNVKYLQRPRRHDLGRMGRRERRPRPGLRQAVALLAGRRTASRSTRSGICSVQFEKNPHSRRLIVSAWNPAEVDAMALPPCHCLFQFYVVGRKAVLPALPALGRHLPRRAVQHRLLRAADDDGGAGARAESPAISSTRSATRISTPTISSRRASSSSARRSRCRPCGSIPR